MRPKATWRTIAAAAVAASLGVIGVAQPAGADPDRAVALPSVDYYADGPTALAAGADGNVWFVAGSSVGRLEPDGDIVSYLLDYRVQATDLVSDPGGIWFIAGRSIGRLTFDGELTSYRSGLTADPTELAVGPDGRIWFAGDAGRLGWISPSGQHHRAHHHDRRAHGVPLRSRHRRGGRRVGLALDQRAG